METLRTFVLAAVIGTVIGSPLQLNAQGFCSSGQHVSGKVCSESTCAGYCGCDILDDYSWCQDSSPCWSQWWETLDGGEENCIHICDSWFEWVCQYW